MLIRFSTEKEKENFVENEIDFSYFFSPSLRCHFYQDLLLFEESSDINLNPVLFFAVGKTEMKNNGN